MNEEKPKGPHIINFEKAKQGKIREEEKRQLEVAHQGVKFRISETQDKLTIRRGLELAKEVLESLHEAALDKSQLDSQRGYAQASSTESLLDVLSLHENSRQHYAHELIYAFAETLLKRFPGPKPPIRR